MTDTVIADPATAAENAAPDVTGVRLALIAQAADYNERRQTHRNAMHDDGTTARCDAYEGLARAEAYGLLLAAILGELDRHPACGPLADALAGVVADVMANGGDGIVEANNDLTQATA